jgi:hypothetical protein
VSGGLPDFFVVGAPRAGTTSLYEYLKTHPQVFMSPLKEPCYFALIDQELPFNGPGDMGPGAVGDRGVRDIESYRALFDGARPGQVRGEASPFYLYSPTAPPRMREAVRDARLIAVLRNPADRAYSHYLLHRQIRREPLADFEAALQAEAERKRANWEWSWHYADLGFYGRQLAALLKHFRREQVLVLTLEELETAPKDAMARVFDFIGVDADFVPPNLGHRYNPAGVPRSAAVDAFLQRPNRLKAVARRLLPERLLLAAWSVADRRNKVRPAFEPAVRARLVETYREDVRALEVILERDLGAWLR